MQLLTKKKQQIDIKKIRSDPAYFVEKVIGHQLPPFVKDWYHLILKKKRVCLMAFRTSGKTSQLFENYFIWCAITKPGTKYAIVSKTLPQAREILKEIRTRILTTPELRSFVPSNRSQIWSASEIELTNHSRILAKAYNENVRGLHLDGIGCDEMGEYERYEVFDKAILPTIRAKRGFFIGVGTPKSELDLLHTIESDAGHASIFFDRYPAEGEKGKLFTQRYPDTYIVHGDAVEIRDKKTKKLLETYSNMTWSQEFLLRPVSLKDKVFPDHLVEACLAHDESYQEGPKVMKQYWMGCDFALSAQSGSDYTVITILEKSPGDHRLRIVDIHRWKGLDYSIQKQRIAELSRHWEVTKILGDEGSFGKTFIYDLKAEGLPIEGYKFTYQSGSKEELIKSLRDQLEKNGLIIPLSKEDHRTYMTSMTLIDELKKFGIVYDYRKGKVSFEGTGKHDDMVISLSLANYIARHVSTKLFAIRRGSSGRSNPFAISVR